VLLVTACLTSVWKVNLTISVASGATLSVGHAAEFMSLLLLGPRHAMLVAVAGAWTQCTFKVKRRYPLYRTAFSMAMQALTIMVTALAYDRLGGPLTPSDFSTLSGPLVGALAAYFFVNTVLIAGAIALSTGQPFGRVWRHDFLWSGVSFMVAGSAGAAAAVVIERGAEWVALLMLAPVYLTYWTYELFVKRLEDQTRHVAETRRLHQETVEALLMARQAARALTDEKERLTVTLRSVGDGVITTDLDSTILSMNRVAEALTRWTQAEAIGKSLADVFQNFDPETWQRCDNSIAELIDDPQARDVGRRSSVRGPRPDRASDRGKHRADSRRRGPRDRHRPRLSRHYRRAQDAGGTREGEQARVARIAGRRHGARFQQHPDGGDGQRVDGRATMARRPSSADWLRKPEQACLRARRLTWQLLTFSKGSVPARKTVALGAILQESVGLALSGSGVGFTLEMPPDLWSVDADAAQLVQAVSDVTLNARQAMPRKGAIAVRAENVSEVDRRWENALRVEPGRYVRVSITDNGVGIPKEHLGRIFDPYFTTKHAGSGLGLATTYSIVKNHGGFLSVDSQLARGTTIHVSFRRSRSGGTAPNRGARAAGANAACSILDDEPSVRRLTMNMLDYQLRRRSHRRERGRHRFKQALTGQPLRRRDAGSRVPGDIGGIEAMNHLGALDPAVKRFSPRQHRP
jgi:signal transduction histidine kinase